MVLKTLFIVSVVSILVKAQSDGRYRSGGNDGRYRPSNDGKYVHDDEKYMHTKDQFGESGETGRLAGVGVVNIGGNRLRPSTTTVATATKTTTKPPLPKSPSPSIYIIDNNRNVAVNRYQDDDSSETKADIKIIRQEQEASENGYRYLYETENGIVAEESGQIERVANGGDVLRTVGFYLYIGDDGKEYRVDYKADENGFQASGEHLPTPPPIPPEIQELLNELATKPPDDV